jgi:hypothetical protein
MDIVLAHADLVEAHLFDFDEATLDVNKKQRAEAMILPL